jgi:hypothetical protein
MRERDPSDVDEVQLAVALREAAAALRVVAARLDDLAGTLDAPRARRDTVGDTAATREDVVTDRSHGASAEAQETAARVVEEELVGP